MRLRLHERTLYLLHNRPRTLTYDEISKQTGLPERWIKEFSICKHSDPRVNRVEKLYTFLAGKQLEL